MQRNKNIKIFLNYFLGPLLFLWLGFAIYKQVKAQPQLETYREQLGDSFSGSGLLMMALIFLLMFVNWGLEAWKWKLSVATVYPVGFLQSFRAVLSGVAFSITMPNRVGEYLGRILYMPDGKRLKAISVTIIASISQLVITMLAGWVGMLVLQEELLRHTPISAIGFRFAVAGLLLVILLTLLFYFNVGLLEKLLEKWSKQARWLYLVEALQLFGMQRLTHLLLLSFTRYMVFLAQYFLAFHLFQVDLSLLHLTWVMSLVFLALSVIPSIVLTEVGIRGAVTLTLVGMFTANSLGILLATITIWLVNLVLPALAGSLFILGIKFFRKST